MRWRLLLEEFDCTYHYKKGETNTVADALSRMPKQTNNENTNEIKTEMKTVSRTDKVLVQLEAPRRKAQHREVQHSKVLETDKNTEKDKKTEKYKNTEKEKETEKQKQTNAYDCLLAYPKFDEQNNFPFHFKTLKQYQSQEPGIQLAVQQHQYVVKRFGNEQLACRRDDNRIILTDAILPKLVRWYHLSSVHLQGMDRLEGTMSRHFYHPRLRDEIRKQISTCHTCQINKRHGSQFGMLAPRDAIVSPWQEVHIDMIGPWRIRLNKVDITVSALTAIDPVTNLLEIVRTKHPITAAEAFRAFENLWLS
jgi:hypothetical protein